MFQGTIAYAAPEQLRLPVKYNCLLAEYWTVGVIA